MADKHTYKAIVDGKEYTRTTFREYRFFWICDVRSALGLKKDGEQGWAYKPQMKDGRQATYGGRLENCRCVPVEIVK